MDNNMKNTQNRQNAASGSVGEENNATVELLCEMHRNVTMGEENLSYIVPHVENKFMLSNITSQLENYAAFAKETKEQLEKRSVKPKKSGAMKKFMSRTGVAMNTMLDSSDSHIAGMIEKGTTMGLEQLEEKRAELEKRGCDGEVIKLCREITDYERRERDKIKDYLAE